MGEAEELRHREIPEGPDRSVPLRLNPVQPALRQHLPHPVLAASGVRYKAVVRRLVTLAADKLQASPVLVFNPFLYLVEPLSHIPKKIS